LYNTKIRIIISAIFARIIPIPRTIPVIPNVIPFSFIETFFIKLPKMIVKIESIKVHTAKKTKTPNEKFNDKKSI